MRIQVAIVWVLIPTWMAASVAQASSTSDATINCFATFDNVQSMDTSQSNIYDGRIVSGGGGGLNLLARGFGNLAYQGGYGATAPAQGAAGRVETTGVTLTGSDLCSSAGGNILTSVIWGRHLTTSNSSGLADALLHFDIDGIHEYRDLGGGSGDWVAYSGVVIQQMQDMGGYSFVDQFFTEASSASGTSGPAGISFENLSSNGISRYRGFGTVSIPVQLKYGPDSDNQVKISYFGGGELNGFSTTGLAVGYASFQGLDTALTSVESLDPNVTFSFTRLPEPGAGVAAAVALLTLAALRRSPLRLEPVRGVATP